MLLHFWWVIRVVDSGGRLLVPITDVMKAIDDLFAKEDENQTRGPEDPQDRGDTDGDDDMRMHDRVVFKGRRVSQW